MATPPAHDDFAAIEAAFYAAQVLVLPAQHLTPSQFVT
jgi:alpha-ketoglutarate-dependent taurine dioxygenase